MKPVLLAALIFGLSPATAALADGKIFVTLPDMTGFAADPVAADQMLRDLYSVLVLGQNCPGAWLSAEEHSLVEDSFDLLAHGALQLNTEEVTARYADPAFALLDGADAAEACAGEAALKSKTLAALQAAGGQPSALPDQEKAYLEWRALMDQIRP